MVLHLFKIVHMKPNTYTKLYAHCIFTPKGRESLLLDSFEEKVHKYIYGTLKGMNCYPVTINGTKDHVHVLAGFCPSLSIENMVRDIKRSSSLFINEQRFVKYKFSWQEGYGAFTVGYRDLDRVFKYITNQKLHHLEGTFKDEYIQIMTEEGVDFKNEYLYEFYD
jgi:putative transposase